MATNKDLKALQEAADDAETAAEEAKEEAETAVATGKQSKTQQKKISIQKNVPRLQKVILFYCSLKLV